MEFVFSFNNTCPTINTNQDLVKSSKEDAVRRIEEAFESFKSGSWCLNDIKESIWEALNTFEEEVKENLENVRSTNMDMRDDAESTIAKLETYHNNEIESRDERITELESEVEELERKLEEYE